MILARVEVPVVFDDISLIAYILGGIIIVPAIFSAIISLILNRKAEKGTRSVSKPFMSTLGAGVLLSIIVASLGYAGLPYIAGKGAFRDVSNYYSTNIVTEDSILPVKLFENSPKPETKNVDVYRVAGGGDQACKIYAPQGQEYILYCDDAEYVP